MAHKNNWMKILISPIIKKFSKPRASAILERVTAQLNFNL